jgi:hypothetical protein
VSIQEAIILYLALTVSAEEESLKTNLHLNFFLQKNSFPYGVGLLVMLNDNIHGVIGHVFPLLYSV